MIDLTQERTTLLAMLRLYCRQRHNSHNLCPACTELWEYAQERLAKCPFGAAKPTCQNCTVHCYQTEMRERIREVMRYAGPRMLWHHPLLAIRHMIRNRKSAAH